MNANRSGDGYVEKGSGIPVVMLPGAEGCKEFWHFQIDALGERYRAIAVDTLVKWPSPASNVADYAAHTLRIMDSLGVDKAVVVGESFGGMITQHIAINHPERTIAVALCNTMDRPRGDSFGWNMFTLATFVAMAGNAPAIPLEIRKSILMWAGKYCGLVYDSTPGNAEVVDYFCEYGAAQGIMAQVDRFMFAGSRARFTDKLYRISVPVLFMHGTDDKVVTDNTTREIAGRIAGCEIALIEGAGHCHQLSMPDETNAKLLDWLDRVTATT